jgi:hypothetical protein
MSFQRGVLASGITMGLDIHLLSSMDGVARLFCRELNEFVLHLSSILSTRASQTSQLTAFRWLNVKCLIRARSRLKHPYRDPDPALTCNAHIQDSWIFRKRDTTRTPHEHV